MLNKIKINKMGNTNSFGKKKTPKPKRKMVYKGYKLITIKRSSKPDKKMDAVFEHVKTKRKKVISFGAKGMSDYTKHKDVERKQRYINRHKKNENWNNLMSAGALSRWILWNKPTLKASIADYKRKFK